MNDLDSQDIHERAEIGPLRLTDHLFNKNFLRLVYRTSFWGPETGTSRNFKRLIAALRKSVLQMGFIVPNGVHDEPKSLKRLDKSERQLVSSLKTQPTSSESDSARPGTLESLKHQPVQYTEWRERTCLKVTLSGLPTFPPHGLL